MRTSKNCGDILPPKHCLLALAASFFSARPFFPIFLPFWLQKNCNSVTLNQKVSQSIIIKEVTRLQKGYTMVTLLVLVTLFSVTYVTSYIWLHYFVTQNRVFGLKNVISKKLCFNTLVLKYYYVTELRYFLHFIGVSLKFSEKPHTRFANILIIAIKYKI